MIFEKIIVGAMQVNCYIVADDDAKKAVVIDPGDDVDAIKAILKKHTLVVAAVVNTHGHLDHIGSDADFEAPIYIHALDEDCLLDGSKNLSSWLGAPFTITSDKITPVKDGDTIRAGSISLEVIHTPGHTRGGMCLLLKDNKPPMLFSGDTLFCQSVGRTDLPGSSTEALLESIQKKLFTLPDDTLVYPGHGPSSTIGSEKRDNPFLR